MKRRRSSNQAKAANAAAAEWAAAHPPLDFAALGDEAPVAAGGRYDGLPGRLGVTTTTGAVGCMVRPARAYAGGQA